MPNNTDWRNILTDEQRQHLSSFGIKSLEHFLAMRRYQKEQSFIAEHDGCQTCEDIERKLREGK